MEEINELAIINHYKSLDDKSKVKFRDKVLEVTGMGYTTWYSKIKEARPFTRAEVIVIGALMKEYENAES